MKPQPGLGIKRRRSCENLADLEHDVELGTIWTHRMSKEIVDSVSDQEKAAAGSYHRGDLYRTRFRA